MEIKVKELGSVEAKSVQEIEGELLAKHEESLSEAKEAPEPVQESVLEDKAPSSLNEEYVLSFIKNRYDKQINSVDELFSAREEASELPEDVAAYMKYKKETGRGIKDFIKLN